MADRIEDRFIDAPLPYPSNVAKQVEISRDLHRELGQLYASACLETHPREAPRQENTDTGLASAYR